jgi:hypothetical protein
MNLHNFMSVWTGDQYCMLFAQRLLQQSSIPAPLRGVAASGAALKACCSECSECHPCWCQSIVHITGPCGAWATRSQLAGGVLQGAGSKQVARAARWGATQHLHTRGQRTYGWGWGCRCAAHVQVQEREWERD